MANLRFQRGLTLIELLVAVAIAALVVAALNSVVALGLNAQASGRQTNELVYQARFALERMAAAYRGATWSTTLYCLDGTNLREITFTTTPPASCTGGAVIATNVSDFSAQLRAGVGPNAGAVDRPAVTLSLTLQPSGAPQTVTFSTSVRRGGGTL